MTEITDDMREKMQAIQGNLGHTRLRNSGARYFRHVDGELVEVEGPSIAKRSMFPYKSVQMAVDPSEVQDVQEQLRKQGIFAEFDEEGRPNITSTKQHDALAKALGMKTGRDGYGHVNEDGKFETSGRCRNDEVQEGCGRVRKAIEELESMPEEVPAHVVDGVLDKYDIQPTEDNTG